ncbi:MAG: hypothetical protein KGO92_13840, partial [Bacteroidota bacterium]|nr:hypothetical protein [Bacteroidota bacterium]
VVDGNLNEWTAAHFETDKESQIQYALDHDAVNLYLAMKVPNFRMQMKMIMQGMKLFIDKKGKRKEGTGIEFPVKREEGSGGFGIRGGRGASGEAGPPDPKEMRARLSANLIFLKTFGFADQEDKTLVIGETGEIGLAYNWDEENNFYIEYAIPLRLIGDQASLQGKTLGIGWKIMGMESSFSGPVSSSTTLVGVPAGGGGGRNGSAGRGAGSRAGGGVNFGQDTDSRFKDQLIWTKYTLVF